MILWHRTQGRPRAGLQQLGPTRSVGRRGLGMYVKPYWMITTGTFRPKTPQEVKRSKTKAFIHNYGHCHEGRKTGRLPSMPQFNLPDIIEEED